MSFNHLNLQPKILQALKKCGYTQPTPIQEQAIPVVLEGKDVIATAQTGTGKTAAFVLPALNYLIDAPKQHTPKILILVPVRELANQITDAIHKYKGEMKVKVVSILGGMPYQAQIRQLSQAVDILVATPGRLIDYLERGHIDLSHIKMLVLDEADRMLDMGFIDDVKLISSHIRHPHQTLLFTATMDEAIRQLAKNILHEPQHITVKGKSITLEKIKQTVYITDDAHHKNKLLEHFLSHENIYKAIIFSATKHHADKIADQLKKHHAVDVLHGDIKQRKRNIIIKQFRQGEINILVATDVAARGIDISDVSHVINYDIPRTAEDYVHRIGRTGRAGKEGIAISFVAYNEGLLLKKIERFINHAIVQQHIPGLEAKHALTLAESKKTKKRHGRPDHKKRRSQDGKNFSSDKKKSRSHKIHAGKKNVDAAKAHSPHSGKPYFDRSKDGSNNSAKHKTHSDRSGFKNAQRDKHPSESKKSGFGKSPFRKNKKKPPSHRKEWRP